MSSLTTRRPRRRSRGPLLRWGLRVLAAAVVFAAGVAVGQALEDRPSYGQQVTSFATIEPWTETGAGAQTATAP